MGFFKKVNKVRKKIGTYVRKTEDYLDERAERRADRAAKRTKYYAALTKEAKAKAGYQKARGTSGGGFFGGISNTPNTDAIMGSFGTSQQKQYETVRVNIKKKRKHQKYKTIRREIPQKRHGTSYFGF